MTFGPGGPHFCTGAHLARLEIEIVFTEMVRRVASFELTGEPERLQSNFFNGIKRMPLRLTPAEPRPELAQGLERVVDVLGAGAEVDEAGPQADPPVDRGRGEVDAPVALRGRRERRVVGVEVDPLARVVTEADRRQGRLAEELERLVVCDLGRQPAGERQGLLDPGAEGGRTVSAEGEP